MYTLKTPYHILGIIGVPGVGKDRLAHALNVANQQHQKAFKIRPYYNTFRASLADVLREIACTVTGEEYSLYQEHPSKDEKVLIGETELPFTRRDLLTDIGYFFEKKVDPAWIVKHLDRNISYNQALRDESLVAVLENDINFGNIQVCEKEDATQEEFTEAALEYMKKVFDEALPSLHIVPDVRQLNQLEWIKNQPNGIVIRITGKKNSRGKLQKIDKLLLDVDVDLEITKEEVEKLLQENPETLQMEPTEDLYNLLYKLQELVEAKAP